MDEANLGIRFKTNKSRELCGTFNHQILAKSELFAGRDPKFLDSVVNELQVQLFPEGDYIMQAGEEGDKMYFLCRGSVEVLVGPTLFKVATLTSGTVFGEGALFGQRLRSATLRATEFCECRAIHFRIFHKILKTYPAERLFFKKIADERKAATNRAKEESELQAARESGRLQAEREQQKVEMEKKKASVMAVITRFTTKIRGNSDPTSSTPDGGAHEDEEGEQGKDRRSSAPPVHVRWKQAGELVRNMSKHGAKAVEEDHAVREGSVTPNETAPKNPKPPDGPPGGRPPRRRSWASRILGRQTSPNFPPGRQTSPNYPSSSSTPPPAQDQEPQKPATPPELLDLGPDPSISGSEALLPSPSRSKENKPPPLCHTSSETEYDRGVSGEEKSSPDASEFSDGASTLWAQRPPAELLCSGDDSASEASPVPSPKGTKARRRPLLVSNESPCSSASISGSLSFRGARPPPIRPAGSLAPLPDGVATALPSVSFSDSSPKGSPTNGSEVEFFRKVKAPLAPCAEKKGPVHPPPAPPSRGQSRKGSLESMRGGDLPIAPYDLIGQKQDAKDYDYTALLPAVVKAAEKASRRPVRAHSTVLPSKSGSMGPRSRRESPANTLVSPSPSSPSGVARMSRHQGKRSQTVAAAMAASRDGRSVSRSATMRSSDRTQSPHRVPSINVVEDALRRWGHADGFPHVAAPVAMASSDLHVADVDDPPVDELDRPLRLRAKATG